MLPYLSLDWFSIFSWSLFDWFFLTMLLYFFISFRSFFSIFIMFITICLLDLAFYDSCISSKRDTFQRYFPNISSKTPFLKILSTCKFISLFCQRRNPLNDIQAYNTKASLGFWSGEKSLPAGHISRMAYGHLIRCLCLL